MIQLLKSSFFGLFFRFCEKVQFWRGSPAQLVSWLLFKLGPRNLAVYSSNVWCFKIQQLYDPSLEIVSYGSFFRIFMGKLEWLVKVFWPNWGRGRPRFTSPSLTLLTGLTFVRVEKRGIFKHGPKIAKNHKNTKNNGTFTLTTLKVVRVKVVLFFGFSNV